MSSSPDRSGNPYVFVVGCPRSGTTLLQRMLNSHPELAVANDTHFIPRVLKQNPSNYVNPALTPNLIEGVYTYHRFHRLGLNNVNVAAAVRGADTYGAFVRGLYNAFARMNEKPLAGEKTPDYCRHIPLLHALFPDARFIHIIRDGRDVALSTLEWATSKKGPGKLPLWNTDPLATCALWWRRQVGMGCRDGRPLGDAVYCEIRYEDLVADSESSLRRLADFLGLDYSPQMAGYHTGKTNHAPGLSAKKAWLPPTKGLRNWRIQVEDEDLAVFEYLTGDLLSFLELPIALTEITSPALSRAEFAAAIWRAHHASDRVLVDALADHGGAP